MNLSKAFDKKNTTQVINRLSDSGMLFCRRWRDLNALQKRE